MNYYRWETTATTSDYTMPERVFLRDLHIVKTSELTIEEKECENNKNIDYIFNPENLFIGE